MCAPGAEASSRPHGSWSQNGLRPDKLIRWELYLVTWNRKNRNLPLIQWVAIMDYDINEIVEDDCLEEGRSSSQIRRFSTELICCAKLFIEQLDVLKMVGDFSSSHGLLCIGGILSWSIRMCSFEMGSLIENNFGGKQQKRQRAPLLKESVALGSTLGNSMWPPFYFDEPTPVPILGLILKIGHDLS